MLEIVHGDAPGKTEKTLNFRNFTVNVLGHSNPTAHPSQEDTSDRKQGRDGKQIKLTGHSSLLDKFLPS